jgi:hypothetical protein
MVTRGKHTLLPKFNPLCVLALFQNRSGHPQQSFPLRIQSLPAKNP